METNRVSIIGISRLRMGTDGHGIRTLVAFHGCSLSCKYCLNPECLGPKTRAKEMSPEEVMHEVPKETTLITKLRYKEDLPLSGYRIPIKLEPKQTYDVTIEINNDGNTTEDPAAKTPPMYVSLGFNLFELMGPSLSFGLNLSHHVMELGAVYGVKTTDELYVYGNKNELLAANYFQAFRVHLSYGYELLFPIQNKKGFHPFTLTPQVGGVFHLYKGREVQNAPENHFYKAPISIAASVGMRLMYKPTKHFSLYLAPEYYFALFKSMEVETLSEFDPVMRNWYSSPSLNAGIMVHF